MLHSYSDTDSEDDDEKLKQVLEAADTTLLTNSMFQSTITKSNIDGLVNENATKESTTLKTPKPPMKSQRHLPNEDTDYSDNLYLSETLRDHVYKRMSNLIAEQVDYYYSPDPVQAQFELKSKMKKSKSRLRLLSDSDCYLKSDAELANMQQPIGPRKKIPFQRRIVENGVELQSEDDRLNSVAITSAYILSGAEMSNWAEKRFRNDKMFRYRCEKEGKLLQAIEPETEFSEIRHRNQWTESRIKDNRKIYS